MDREDQELETLLRRFQPEAPAPLPDLEPVPRIWARWLVPLAAALVAGVGVWQMTRELSLARRAQAVVVSGTSERAIEWPIDTLGGMSAAVGSEPDRLDLVLGEASRRLLPNVEQSGGVLQVLAKPFE